MKKLLISLLVVAISFSGLHSLSYTLTDVDEKIAYTLFSKIVEIAKEKQGDSIYSEKADLYAMGIKNLLINLQKHPKATERTIAVFDKILIDIIDFFECSGYGEATVAAMKPEFQEKIDMLNAVNTERKKEGKKFLALNDLLNIAAQKHAEYMNATKDFNHTTLAGLRFDQRISNEGYIYNYAGENIAYGQDTVTIVMETRMNSPGHKTNILEENFTQLGVGHAGIYRVQVFARPQ